jgi:hypothetical protein
MFMDKINKKPDEMPFFPFPPNKQANELNKKPDENPFFPFPPKKETNELNKKPDEMPFFPFPPNKETDKKQLVNESLIQDKVTLSTDNIRDGIDLSEIKDVFIKSQSVM